MSIRILIVILLAAAVTFSLRAFPFLIFSGEQKLPEWLERLGKALPSAIMAVLIIYCLKDVKTQFATKGLAQLLAAAVVVVSYKLGKNTLVSIILGTAACMILYRVLG